MANPYHDRLGRFAESPGGKLTKAVLKGAYKGAKSSAPFGAAFGAITGGAVGAVSGGIGAAAGGAISGGVFAGVNHHERTRLEAREAARLAGRRLPKKDVWDKPSVKIGIMGAGLAADFLVSTKVQRATSQYLRSKAFETAASMAANSKPRSGVDRERAAMEARARERAKADPINRKISALRAKANDPSVTAHERRAFSAKADELSKSNTFSAQVRRKLKRK